MARAQFAATMVILVLLVAIGCRLEIVRDDTALARTAGRAADALPMVARDATLPEPAAARRALIDDVLLPRDAGSAPPPRTRRSRFRVHGQVRGGSGPVDDFDLTFCETGAPATDPVDWDFTDLEGRYEVEVAAGTYVVRDAEGRQVAIIDVPGDCDDEQWVDLFVSEERRGPATDYASR